LVKVLRCFRGLLCVGTEQRADAARSVPTTRIDAMAAIASHTA
jgi:hypothetical protein